jgi:hypothetical protein
MLDSCRSSACFVRAAINRWSLMNNATNGTPVRMEQLLPFLPGHVAPICPEGGTYTNLRVGHMPRCTVHGQLWQYEDL